MAILSIDILSEKFISSSGAKFVLFDGRLSVTPVFSNTVTRRPVEDGFDANDAVHNNSTIVDIEIVITDTPQSILDERVLSSLPNILGPKLIQSYTKKQLEQLKAMSNNRETVTIKTKYDTYENYFLENFTYSEDEDDALVIRFTIIENRDSEVVVSKNIDDSLGLFS